MPLPKSMIEAELPARAQQGDENALAALIARMMPAIRKGAADCTAPGLDFDDAVQEGLIGLFRAVREYDPAVGPTFAAFAAASIRHAQQDARRAQLDALDLDRADEIAQGGDQKQRQQGIEASNKLRHNISSQ